ncbi:zinc finger MYND domain-containing protein [archaeon]|nr:MAG: zinc finger MYND domain-containing protein [archaeon]
MYSLTQTLFSKAGNSIRMHVEPPTKRCHNFSNLPFTCPTAENLKACARCKAAFYCSKDCQVADWRHHKRSCLPVSS